MKKSILALGLAVAAMTAFSLDAKSRTEKREFAGKDGTVLRYRWAEKLPASGEKVPLVVLLHGAGERGDDNTAQLVHGAKDILDYLDANEKGYRFVAGQVPHGKRWVEVNWSANSHKMPKKPSESMALLLELLDSLLADPRTDADRVYVTGISMGGYGTWDIVSRRPEIFAAAIPICGGGDVSQAARLANVRIWAFHGSADGIVPVSRSRNMVSAIWAAGGDAHYREYPGVNHNSWTQTYRDKTVLKWFFGRLRKK